MILYASTTRYESEHVAGKRRTHESLSCIKSVRPNGQSLHYAVDKICLRNLQWQAGNDALFVRLDCSDAYKLISCQTEDWRMYRFKWLDKYLHETQTTILGPV